jgi:inosine triphosphate pyrophosphatase
MSTTTTPLKVLLVTSNAGKIAEISRALATSSTATTTNITIEATNIDLPELQGEPEYVAEQKCKEARAILSSSNSSTKQCVIMVEDTSLCFNALHGLPGVFVKWFLEKTGREGLIKLLQPYQDKTAYAQCIFAISVPGRDDISLITGKTHGIVVDSPRGPKDSFGWDPVFQPNESGGRTYAEMTKDEKNLISHRGRAMTLVIDFLQKLSLSSSSAAVPDEKKQRISSQ